MKFKMVKSYTLLKLAGLLACYVGFAGCQTVPQASGQSTPVSSAPVVATDNEAVAADDPKPQPELTPELVYSVLAAEIAGQRGDFELAYQSYLDAAELSRNAKAAEKASRIAAYMDDQEAVLKAARIWSEIAPEDLAAQQVVGAMLVHQDDIDAALPYLARIVITLDEQGKSGFLIVANLLSKDKNKERALDVMQRLAKEFPESADIHYSIALLAVQADQLELAHESVDKALEFRPDWSKAIALRGAIFQRQDDNVAALKAVAEGVESNPDDILLRTSYARLLVEMEEYELARDQFRALLELNPDQPDTLIALAILEVQLDNDEAAEKLLHKLMGDEQRRYEAALYLGQISESRDDTEQALIWYRQAAADRATEIEASVRIANLLAKTGRLDEARELLARMRHRSVEQSVDLYLIEGSILNEVGKPRAAIELYDRALEDYPEDVDLLYARALQAVEIDRIDILERDLRDIIGRDPDNVDALNALGYTLADQTERYEEAMGYITRALELKPENPAILDSMGWVHYRLGNYEEAKTYLRKALSLLPDAEIAAHLGEVLWMSGDKEQANKVWDKALTLHPEDSRLRNVVDHFRSEADAGESPRITQDAP